MINSVNVTTYYILDYHLILLFNTQLKTSETQCSSKEALILQIIESLDYVVYSNSFYVVRLADAVKLNCFDEIYALLSMTQHARLAYECKLLLP